MESRDPVYLQNGTLSGEGREENRIVTAAAQDVQSKSVPETEGHMLRELGAGPTLLAFQA